MNEVTFKDMPTDDYTAFQVYCSKLERPFTLVLTENDVTDTINTKLKHIKYAMLPAILADKVVYKDKVLKDRNAD